MIICFYMCRWVLFSFVGYYIRNLRYHISEWENEPKPQLAQEKFNKVHSALCSAIEENFGVWKAIWPLLKGTLKKLVLATMAIHNFIRCSRSNDIPFDSYIAHPNFVPEDKETHVLDRNTFYGRNTFTWRLWHGCLEGRNCSQVICRTRVWRIKVSVLVISVCPFP